MSSFIEAHRGRPLALAMAVVFALSAALFLAYLRFALQQPPVNDFLVFWSAARQMQQAPLQDVYDPLLFDAFKHGIGGGLYSKLPFLYPPIAAGLFFPFGLLPYGWALLLWNSVSLVLYAGAVWLAIRPHAVAPAAALAAAVAPATVVTLLGGQIGLLISAATLLGVCQLGRRPWLAGTLLGLLAVKPQLALLPGLVLLCSGQGRACLAAALTVALLALLSVIFFGADAWLAWARSLGGFAADLQGSQAHQQFGITVYFALLDLGLNRYAALAAQTLVAAAVLRSIVIALRQGLGTPQRLLILVGLYLATPYALVYDMPAVTAACLILLAEGRASGFRRGELPAIACAWCMPLLLVLPQGRSSVLGVAVLAGLFVVMTQRAGARVAQPAR